MENASVKQGEMKLSDKDMERVELIMQLIGEKSRTKVVMTALELAEIVFKNMKSGNEIAIEHPDQQKEYIRIMKAS